MNPDSNPRREAALRSLQAAFAERRRLTRPEAVVTADPHSRRLVLKLVQTA
jgi:hypothetical protein